jgi:hypothetical protein
MLHFYKMTGFFQPVIAAERAGFVAFARVMKFTLTSSIHSIML